MFKTAAFKLSCIHNEDDVEWSATQLISQCAVAASILGHGADANALAALS